MPAMARVAAAAAAAGPEHAFTVEYARSGQARCHSTNELIPRGALRIGVVIKSQFGDGRGRGTLWHDPEAFFRRHGHSGLISTALLHNFEQLRPEDRKRIQGLVEEALRPDDLARRSARATARAGPPAETRNALLLMAAAALLLLCEYVLPSAGALERAGKAARLRGWRQLYTAINFARTYQLRLRWRCCRRRPAFSASEVAPGLFLGSMADAHNLEELQARGIVAVVTISPGIPPPFASRGGLLGGGGGGGGSSIRYLCLDVIDLPDEQLRGHFCTPHSFTLL